MFQTFTPREYLKIDIANNYGHNLDKDDWDVRLDWFDKHESQLHELIASAEQPALFYAGILAWEDVQANKPIGYMVSLDATSSGLQLLAALTGDRKASLLCNVIDAGHRADAYTGIYVEMTEEIGDTAKIGRTDTKQAIMTSLYGSTAMPKKVFGEGALLDVFYAAMKRNAPAAWELNEAFLAMWDPEAFKHSWVLPDNFHVHVKVMDQVKETVHFLNQPFDVFYNVNMPTPEGRSLGANTIHSIDGMIVRELTRRCSFNPEQVTFLRELISQECDYPARVASDKDKLVVALWEHYNTTGFLSARILDVLNADNLGHVDRSVITDLLDSLPAKPFNVVSIHDCFRCLPTYANDLRYQYNLQLQMIAQSDLLGNLISQIIGKRVHIGKLDPNLYIEIIDSNYALS